MPDISEIVKDSGFQGLDAAGKKEVLDAALSKDQGFLGLKPEEQSGIRSGLYAKYTGGTAAPATANHDLTGTAPPVIPQGQSSVPKSSQTSGFYQDFLDRKAAAQGSSMAAGAAQGADVGDSPNSGFYQDYLDRKAATKAKSEPRSNISPLALRTAQGKLATATIGPPHATPPPNPLQQFGAAAGAVLGYPQGLVNAAALPVHQALNSRAGQLPPTPAGAQRDQASVDALMKMNPFQRAVALTGQNPLDPLMGRPAAQSVRDTATGAQFGALGSAMKQGTQIATDPVTYVFGPAGKLLPSAARKGVMAAFTAQMSADAAAKLQQAAQGNREAAGEAAILVAMSVFGAKHGIGEIKEGMAAAELRKQIAIRASEGNPVSPLAVARLASRFNVPIADIAPKGQKPGLSDTAAKMDEALRKVDQVQPISKAVFPKPAADSIAAGVQGAESGVVTEQPAAIPPSPEVAAEIARRAQARRPQAQPVTQPPASPAEAPKSEVPPQVPVEPTRPTEANVVPLEATPNVEPTLLKDNALAGIGDVASGKKSGLTVGDVLHDSLVGRMEDAALSDGSPLKVRTVVGKELDALLKLPVSRGEANHPSGDIRLLSSDGHPRGIVISPDVLSNMTPDAIANALVHEIRHAMQIKGGMVPDVDYDPSAKYGDNLPEQDSRWFATRVTGTEHPSIENVGDKAHSPTKGELNGNTTSKTGTVTVPETAASERAQATAYAAKPDSKAAPKATTTKGNAPDAQVEFADWVAKQPQDKTTYTSAKSLYDAWKKENPGITKAAFGQMLHDLPREQYEPTSTTSAAGFNAVDSTGTPRKFNGVRRVALAEEAKPVPAPEPPASIVAKPEYGAYNKIVTREEYAATLARLKKNIGKLSAGIDPESLGDLVKLGAFHFEAGTRIFATWAKAIRSDLGNVAEDHLKAAWEHVKAGTMPEPAEPGFTGARNAVVETERAARNQPEVDRQPYNSTQDAFEMGKAAIARGRDHAALAEEVASKPRVLSTEEVGVLAQGRYLLKNEYNRIGAEMDQAIKDKNPATSSSLRNDLLDVEAKFNRNDEALVKGGREQSAAFAARKILIDDKGDFLQQKTRARRIKGSDLTTLEEAGIKASTEEHKAALADLEVQKARVAQLEAEKAVRNIADIATMDKRRGRIKDLAIERKSLVQSILDMIGKPTTLNSGPKLAVDLSITVGKLAINWIESGYHTLALVTAKVREDIPELTERQVHDALSGYGRDLPKTMSELKKKIAELKKEARLTSQTADEPGVDTRVPKEPSQTDNDHIRSMRDELSEYRKQRKRWEDIADLEAQLAAGDIIPKGTKKAYPKSEMESRLAELKKQYSEAQTNMSIADDLRNRIEHEKNGVDTRTKPGEPRVQSEEEQNLRNELEQYRRQRDTKATIDRLEKRLAENDIEAKPVDMKNRPQSHDEQVLANLKKKYAEKQADLSRLDNLRNQIDMERQGADTRMPKGESRTPLSGEEALVDERNKLRAERDTAAKVEDLTKKLNLSEIDPKTAAKNLPKTEAQTRLDELNSEYRRRQADLSKVTDLEDKLRLEKAGTDTRQKAKPRVLPQEDPEFKAKVDELQKAIETERRIRDLNERARVMEGQYKEGIYQGHIKMESSEPDMRLRAAIKRVATSRARVDAAIEALQPKSGLDRIVDYGRAAKLAGVGVFAKLAGASAWAMPTETLANLISSPFGNLKVKGVKLSAIAEREGKFYWNAEKLGYKKFVSREALENAKDVFKNAYNKINAETGDIHGGDELSSYPGRLHGTVKSFLQTAEYHKAFESRMNRAAEQAKAAGEPFDINDPALVERVGYGAAMDAQSMILQGDNKMSDLVKILANAPERLTANGPYSPIGKLATAFLKILAPITKVPANYIGGTIQMTGLGIVEGAYRHARAQASPEPLTAAEADGIIRAYKYGGLGMVAMVIGLTQPPFFKSAGFYPAYKGGTKPNKDNKGQEMNPSELQVAGVRVPHLIAHSKFLESVQFWATVRRALEQKKGEGVWEASKGVLEQAPGLESHVAAGNALLGEGYDVPGYWGELGRGVVEPQVINEIAKYTDMGPKGIPNSRKSTGFVNNIRAGIPTIGPIPAKFSRKGLPLKGAEAAPTEEMDATTRRSNALENARNK